MGFTVIYFVWVDMCFANYFTCELWINMWNLVMDAIEEVYLKKVCFGNAPVFSDCLRSKLDVKEIS